ncbi:MAG TPA: urease accessory UreF family protein [Burkholderiaceae bacterium]
MKPADAHGVTGSARLSALVRALHLASPALPVGGYAYSQALERAIEDGLIDGEAAALRWISDLLLLAIARFEAPLWLRAHAARNTGDEAGFARLNAEMLAARETAELRAESRQMGASLVKLFPAFGIAAPAADPIAYPAAFAAACAGFGLDREAGLAAYLWAWAENQVLAVVKALPLGQLAGQRMLIALHATLARALGTALEIPDEELGSAPVRFAIVSARHEFQYSRLFRS